MIEAAASSRDIRCEQEITVENRPLKQIVTMDTLLGDVIAIPGAKEVIAQELGKDVLDHINPWILGLGFHILVHAPGANLTRARLEEVAEKINRL